MPLPSDFFAREATVTILGSLSWKSKELFVCLNPQQPSDLALVLRPQGEGAGAPDEILLVDRQVLLEFARGLVAKLGN